MNIVMAGIDYHTAKIDYREEFSFTKSKIREIIKDISQKYQIGVVLLCTCNRTEIYISYYGSENEINPMNILCEYAGVDVDVFKQYFFIREKEEVVKHLMEVSCGIHSKIFGEDQIISQVKYAIRVANEEKTSNSVLNTLFRYAITCSKKVKTKVSLRAVSPSVACEAVNLLDEFIKENNQAKVLVIGNGEIGRDVCNKLVAKGCVVYLTLRTYKHGVTIVPNGCSPIDYDAREECVGKVDIVISATLSPHYTIKSDMLNKCKKKPKYIIDLAVPRDIDSAVERIEGINYFNIDTIGKTALKDNSKELEVINEMIQEQMAKFYEWFIVHKYTDDISLVKDLTVEKVSKNMQKELSEEEKIEKAISKTVEYIMYSIKDDISTAMFSKIKEGINSRR